MDHTAHRGDYNTQLLADKSLELLVVSSLVGHKYIHASATYIGQLQVGRHKIAISAGQQKLYTVLQNY